MPIENTLSNKGLGDQVNDLYTENHGWLQGWLNKKLGCSFRAADLMHDTFLRLLMRDEQIQACEPKAYLMTIAKRVLIDHWRRERVEKAYIDALMNIPEVFTPTPEEQHIVLETLVEIDRLLADLPTIVKRAFLYAQLEGLKQAEIANKLNISVSTVKRYLIQAGTQCYFAISETP
ncbi:sigma-70 family RNA polymerase sigma factor [Shewanella sp. A14]